MSTVNSKMTSLRQYYSTILLSLFLLSTPAGAETIRYVSDDLRVPMRSGTTIRHKILAFLNSGTPVKILEESDDGHYARVSIEDGKQGWVKTEHLMNVKSARDRLVTANQRLDASKEQIASLKQTASELESQINQLEDSRKQLMNQNSELENMLEELRTTAAQPIAIGEQNKKLQAQIDEVTERNKQLVSENARLNDNSLKEWFIIGAVVALGSLILGLIIPNIKWRKKDSWAGSF